MIHTRRYLSDILKQYSYLTTKLELSVPRTTSDYHKKKWFKAHIIRMVLLEFDGKSQVSKQINYAMDEECSKCMRCDSKFTMLRRRHHCIFCGNIFCDTCSPRVEFRNRRTRKVEIVQRTCSQCLKSFMKTKSKSNFCVNSQIIDDERQEQKMRKKKQRNTTMSAVSVENVTSTTTSIRWSAIQGELYDLQVASDSYFSNWEDLRILVDREGDLESGARTIGRYIIRGLEPNTQYVGKGESTS